MALPQATHLHLEREVEALRARVAELEAWNEVCEKAGEAFIKSGETFRKVFDHSNDGILILDPEKDRVVDVNQRACEMLGHSFEELVELPLSKVYPNDMHRLLDLSSEASKNGRGVTTELTCRLRDGRELPVEVSASMIDLPNGRYLIALVRDIQERKEAEAERRRAHERTQSDLRAAARLQRSLLPQHTDIIDGIRTGWEFEPSELLAGDLLNLFKLDADHLGMYVLDVSGHGITAAMQSLTLHRSLSPFPNPTSLLLHQEDWERSEIVPPAQVATELSRIFPMNEETGQYFTLLYGILNRKTREFRFVSAGHCPPIYAAPGQPPREIAHYGYPVGIVPDEPYEDHTITLEPGARLYLYSDGLTEAGDPEGNLFGVERLLDTIEAGRSDPLQDSIGTIMRRVKDWTCATCPRDDVSLLAVELRG